MSATVTGLENLMKTFFDASDDENAEEKDAGKSEGPSGEKTGQASPAHDTEASGKQGLGVRLPLFTKRDLQTGRRLTPLSQIVTWSLSTLLGSERCLLARKGSLP